MCDCHNVIDVYLLTYLYVEIFINKGMGGLRVSSVPVQVYSCQAICAVFALLLPCCAYTPVSVHTADRCVIRSRFSGFMKNMRNSCFEYFLT